MVCSMIFGPPMIQVSLSEKFLEKAGVFSAENLAFKMLRRSEALSKLHDVYIKAYDRALSLDQ